MSAGADTSLAGAATSPLSKRKITVWSGTQSAHIYSSCVRYSETTTLYALTKTSVLTWRCDTGSHLYDAYATPCFVPDDIANSNRCRGASAFCECVLASSSTLWLSPRSLLAPAQLLYSLLAGAAGDDLSQVQGRCKFARLSYAWCKWSHNVTLSPNIAPTACEH